MFQQTRRSIALLGGAICLSLVLGVAAAAGVSSQSDPPDTAQAVAAAPTTTVAPAEAQAVPDAEPSAPAAPAEPQASPPSTSAPEVAAPEEAAPQETFAAPAEPQSTVVARANPSSAQVVQAMRTMQARIPFLPINESYGRQFGDEVCTAFDQGTVFGTVVAGVVAAASKVPLVTISTADAEYAVRTAVQLFCPGHSANLG